MEAVLPLWDLKKNGQLLIYALSILLYSYLVLISVDINLDGAIVTLSFYVLVALFSTPVYFITSYYIIPQYFYRENLLMLSINIIVVLVLCTFFSLLSPTIIMTIFYPKIQFGITYPNLLKTGILNSFFDLLVIFSWNNILGMATSAAISVYRNKISVDDEIMDLEKEKLTTELSNLKNQTNPEFLLSMMQTLKNNIVNETHEVQESVDIFSNLLHYQVYECVQNFISIEKEITFINSYIEVQKRRLEKGVYIRFQRLGNLSGFKIAPMMILPLVENAFKHISNYANPEENRIDVKITKEKNRKFIVEVYNTCDNIATIQAVKKSNGGVGLVNLKRRLELIYPENHDFKTELVDGIFYVSFTIEV
ncbi:MAG: histidine kinase [Chitinophagales bacterium]|nr:histidine kinase [Chitinophagales bacterium]